MRRSEKKWMEYNELTTPFLTPDSDESVTSVAIELRDRMVKVEQQVLAQYTATAAYATLAQQGVDNARAEARSDLDRVQSTVLGLLDKLRAEQLNGFEGEPGHPSAAATSLNLDADARLTALEDRIADALDALERTAIENAALRQQVDALLAQQMQSQGWLASSGSATDLSLL
ncbi:MAG: hypothetical protein WCI22_10090 [Actinomycetota bacterium]